MALEVMSWPSHCLLRSTCPVPNLASALSLSLSLCANNIVVLSRRPRLQFARKALREHNDADRCARELVAEALSRESRDNVTVVRCHPHELAEGGRLLCQTAEVLGLACILRGCYCVYCLV